MSHLTIDDYSKQSFWGYSFTFTPIHWPIRKFRKLAFLKREILTHRETQRAEIKTFTSVRIRGILCFFGR